jgi:serine/threonine protein kinase
MMEATLPRRFGPYVLLSERGRGGMGSVFLARPVVRPEHPARARVIVKLLHPSLLDDAESLQRFRHEAMIAVSVSSPEVVQVFDVGRVGDVPYIAMEYIAGWSALEVVRAALDATWPLPAPLVVAWLCDALAGLEALHTAVHPTTAEPLGVVHRDISPKNLLIDEDLQLRVIDFGLGTSNVQDWATRADVLLGTPGYIAPEQVEGRRVDQRTDLYALGVVAFELLTLTHYVPRGDRSAMFQHILSPRRRSLGRADVPPALERVIFRALSVAPDARPDSARELRELLLPFAAPQRDAAALPPNLATPRDAAEVELTEPGVARAVGQRPEPTVLFAVRAPTAIADTQLRRRLEPAPLAGEARAVPLAEHTSLADDRTADTTHPGEVHTQLRGAMDEPTRPGVVSPARRELAGERTTLDPDTTRLSGDRTHVRSTASAAADRTRLTEDPTRATATHVLEPSRVAPTVTAARPLATSSGASASPTPRRAGLDRSTLALTGLMVVAASTLLWLALTPAPPPVEPLPPLGSPSTTPAEVRVIAARPAVTTPTSAASSAQTPSVVAPPRADPSQSPGHISSATDPTRPPTPTRSPTRSPTPAPTRSPTPAPTRSPTEPGVASPAPRLDPDELLARLMARAARARQRFPERSAALDTLVADASLWSRADDEARARSALAELEQRLTQLEAPQ